MPLFLSTTVNRVDRKGRISVPANFRASLPAGAYQGIVLYPSFKHPCIHGADMGFFEHLSDSIHGDFGLFSDAHEALANATLAESFQLNFDPEGRVTLPVELLSHASINREASFVGLGRTFQIWNPETYQAHRLKQRELAEQEAANLKPVIRRSDGGER
jgi:MraZ protein